LSLLHRLPLGEIVFSFYEDPCRLLAHRDLASTIHFRNGAESGHRRADANDPKPSQENGG